MNQLVFSGYRISWTFYVYLAVGAAIIYILFFFLKRFVLPLLREEHFLIRYPNLFPLIEEIVWIIFAMVCIYYLILPHPLIGLVFIVILVAASWTGLQDIAAGIWIRATDSYREGDYIGLYEKEGKIGGMGLMVMHVEEAEGKVLEYPYSRVLKAPMVLKKSFGKLESYAFDLEIAHMNEAMDYHEALEGVVFNLPWAPISRKPNIEILKNQQGFKVILYSIDNRFFPKMESLIREEIAKMEKAN